MSCSTNRHFEGLKAGFRKKSRICVIFFILFSNTLGAKDISGQKTTPIMSAPETLPVYWATLDDDVHGLSFVSLVDKPAIERTFVALAAAKRVSV